jgi:predicted DNA-binding transcriptional regulator YafY
MSVIDTIRTAGRERLLITFSYDGDPHTVEPYSFRDRSGHFLFFGHCQKCGRINAFDPNKMSSVEITGTPYAPRWPVEL